MVLTDAQRHAIAAGKVALNSRLTEMNQQRMEAHFLNSPDLVAEWDSHITRTVRDIETLDDLLSAPSLRGVA